MKKLILLVLAICWTVQSHALTPCYVEWPASVSATGYRVYYGTSTGVYSMVADVATLYASIWVDETAGIYLAVKAYNAVGESAYSPEFSGKFVTTTISPSGASLSWNSIQVVESGQAHSITVTPESGYVMTAYRIDGGAWQEYPSSNEISMGTVSANKTLEIITQRQATVRP